VSSGLFDGSGGTMTGIDDGLWRKFEEGLERGVKIERAGVRKVGTTDAISE